MSDETSPTEAVPESTEARFSIRALLVVTAVLAILAAVAGPWIRDLQPDAQTRVLVASCLWLAAGGVAIGYQMRQRFQLERMAGKVLLRIPAFDKNVPDGPADPRWKTFGSLLLYMLCTLFFAGPLVLDSSWLPLSSFTLLYTGVYVCVSISCLAQLAGRFCWGNSVRFCEFGVVCDRQFLRWDHVVDQKWKRAGRLLQLSGIDQNNTEVTLKIPVVGERLLKVQAILDIQAASRPSVSTGPDNPAAAAMSDLGHIPLSVAIRHPDFFRYLGVVAILVFVLIATMCFLFTGTTGIDEFFVIGLVFAGSWGSWRWQVIGGNAGAPRVRLRARENWWHVCSILLVAVALYPLGQLLVPLSLWCAYAARVGFGFLIGVTLAYAVRMVRQLDLREHGLVLQGVCYWPWNEVRLVAWNPADRGRLVLGRGWRRVVALVPREQREAVDALLKEKLAH